MGLPLEAAPAAMENQMVRLPPDLRVRVRERAERAGVPPSRLFRQYIEAGDRADMRREQKEAGK
jgi:hypothetical protein